jgi:hypothetical protein
MGGGHLDGSRSHGSDGPGLAILEPLGFGLAVILLVCCRAHSVDASASKAVDGEDDIDRLVHRHIPFAGVSLGFRARRVRDATKVSAASSRRLAISGLGYKCHNGLGADAAT